MKAKTRNTRTMTKVEDFRGLKPIYAAVIDDPTNKGVPRESAEAMYKVEGRYYLVSESGAWSVGEFFTGSDPRGEIVESCEPWVVKISEAEAKLLMEYDYFINADE